MRKTLSLLAAGSVTLAAVAALASPGAASVHSKRATPVDATNDAVVCTLLSGSVTFTPPLSTGGTASGHETDAVSAKLDHCKVSGLHKRVKLTGGTVTGKLVSNDGSRCVGLLDGAPPKGLLTFKWEGTKLSSGNSLVHVRSIDGSLPGGVVEVIIPAAAGPASTATGSFSKSHGANDSITVYGGKESALVTKCNDSKLSKLVLKSGTISLR
ncbi:MAG: hypothetical protein ACLPQS_04325 [Acidimicrobiales bacterium]